MPDFQITGTATELVTEDDLFALVKDLHAQGWTGTVGVQASHAGQGAPLVWTLDVHKPDPNSPTGARTMTARVGDMKVTVGSTISVMTPEAYQAAYGSA